jgi:hypothetical protein
MHSSNRAIKRFRISPTKPKINPHCLQVIRYVNFPDSVIRNCCLDKFALMTNLRCLIWENASTQDLSSLVTVIHLDIDIRMVDKQLCFPPFLQTLQIGFSSHIPKSHLEKIHINCPSRLQHLQLDLENCLDLHCLRLNDALVSFRVRTDELSELHGGEHLETVILKCYHPWSEATFPNLSHLSRLMQLSIPNQEYITIVGICKFVRSLRITMDNDEAEVAKQLTEWVNIERIVALMPNGADELIGQMYENLFKLPSLREICYTTETDVITLRNPKFGPDQPIVN